MALHKFIDICIVAMAVCSAMLLSGWFAVHDYKSRCEPMSTNAYHVQWLECTT